MAVGKTLEELLEKAREWWSSVDEAARQLKDQLSGHGQPVLQPIRIDDRPRRRRPRRNSALVMALGAGALLTATPAHATQSHKHKTTPVAHHKQITKGAVAGARLGVALAVSDLNRIAVGNQAGIMKVYAPNHQDVAFMKDAPGTDLKGIDGTQWAPLDAAQRAALLASLPVSVDEESNVAANLMRTYPTLGAQRRTALALLGAMAATPDDHLDEATRAQIRHFLCQQVSAGHDVSLHRQAVLALALASGTDAESVNTVIDFMSRSHNAWETFTTQQFFQYHRGEICAMSDLPVFETRLQNSGNPYGADLAAFLGGR
jgi:hypothetical protein